MTWRCGQIRKTGISTGSSKCRIQSWQNITNRSIIPQKPEGAFPLICHFVFAVVIAGSYDLAARVFLSPEDPVYSGLDPFLVALELTVAYVSVITGWLGYARSGHRGPRRVRVRQAKVRRRHGSSSATLASSKQPIPRRTSLEISSWLGYARCLCCILSRTC